MRYAPCAAVAVFLLTAAAAQAAPHVSVELVRSVTAVEPGGQLTVAAVFKIEKGWHLYWINPGETGSPPEVKWTAPAGVTVGPPQFPTPKTINANGLTAYGYEDTLVLLYDVSVPKDAKGDIELKADANWVVCSDACVAESQVATMRVPTAEKRGQPNRPEQFEQWRGQIPLRVRTPITATIDADGKHGTIEMKHPDAGSLISLFPPLADFAEWEKPVVKGDVIRLRFRVLPNPPASHEADTVAVFNHLQGNDVAVIQQVQFKFQVPHKE